MAVIQISRIQHRRGLQADLPNLASAELGWSVDTRKLYIGNGTTEEGAPSLGRTEILTQYSILDFESSFTANIAILQSNVVVLSGNVVSLENRVTSLENAVTNTSSASLLGSVVSAQTITNTSANNAVITYTMSQGSAQRTGTIKVARVASDVSYEEDYTETGATDIVFTMNANVTHTNLNYTSSTAANLTYRINSL
jgi:hypothetical protein